MTSVVAPMSEKSGAGALSIRLPALLLLLLLLLIYGGISPSSSPDERRESIHFPNVANIRLSLMVRNVRVRVLIQYNGAWN